MTVSEQELYGGSAKAVRCFVSKTLPRFFREEDIEDMTNEVALKAWKASDSFDPAKGAFYPWLWTIAKRLGVSKQTVYMAVYHLRQRLRHAA